MKRLALAIVLASGCHKATDPEPAEAGAPSPEPTLSAEATPLPPADAGAIEGAMEALRVPMTASPRARSAAAGGKVEIPGGSYPAGSTPGDDGRDVLVEPAQVPIELAPFSIDALPYPGEPGSASRTAGAGEAAQLCQERSGRLCSEWEWERACRGPELDVYATGASWDPACEKEPQTCASGYGVRAQGVTRELVAGGARGFLPLPEGWKSETGAHRCARRSATSESSGTFRCCYGAAPAATKLPEIAEYPAYRSYKLDDAELAALVARTPELARLGEAPRFWTAEAASQAYARSDTSREGIKFTSAPLLWSPERGVELVVLTGRTQKNSFVLAFYPLANHELRLASSMIFLRDVAPIVLAYRASARRELLWTSFWGSRTDEGYVSWRDDQRVVIVQK